MTRDDLTQQLAGVYAKYGVPALAPDEWSMQMFADANGLTYNQAELVVRRALVDGEVVRVGRRTMPTGHQATCYTISSRMSNTNQRRGSASSE